MKSDITNCYKPEMERPKVASETQFLYQPDNSWTYSHHAHITCFNGRFYAIWSNGRINEDNPGQRILLSTSENFTEWSKPVPLIDSTMGKYSELVLTAAGFHIDDGVLAAYFGQYEFKPDEVVDKDRVTFDTGHIDTCLKAVTTRDGVNWSAPIDIELPIVPNHGPQKTESGRLIICGNIMFPYTDKSSGLSDWKTTGIFSDDMKGSICDDSESFVRINKAMKRDVLLCEGSFFQTDDDMIHMMLRSNTANLWVSESHDDGASWSSPCLTDFTDNGTKFHFGKLPDGRFYYVGNPDPLPPGTRNPLVISLSVDGQTFGKHYILKDEAYAKRFEGLYKGGTYGYPHSMIHQGYLYVIYSLMKESIAVSRIKIDDL
ncbi:MAG: exo-alpha-sialidase [Saccharofermentanales bacterium]